MSAALDLDLVAWLTLTAVVLAAGIFLYGFTRAALVALGEKWAARILSQKWKPDTIEFAKGWAEDGDAASEAGDHNTALRHYHRACVTALRAEFGSIDEVIEHVVAGGLLPEDLTGPLEWLQGKRKAALYGADIGPGASATARSVYERTLAEVEGRA